MHKWIAPAVSVLTAIVGGLAAKANVDAGTLTNAGNAAVVGGLGLTAVVSAFLTDFKTLLGKQANGYVPPLPGTGLVPGTLTQNDFLEMFQRAQDLAAGKVVTPTKTVTPTKVTVASPVDGNGRFVITPVVQRDNEAIHHLSSRAAEVVDRDLQKKMMGLCRELSDCTFELHHGRLDNGDAKIE